MKNHIYFQTADVVLNEDESVSTVSKTNTMIMTVPKYRYLAYQLYLDCVQLLALLLKECRHSHGWQPLKTLGCSRYANHF
jgi:hypothetical protein